MSGALPPHSGDAPPPYSETDIYSNSGAAAHPSAPPTTADDVASRMSSSNEEIIYTPPDTPRTTGTAPASVITGISQPGADLYFETRPPPPPDVVPQSALVHALRLDTQSLPDDFPFPSDWEKRDVNAQDWATFVNFLLPDHTTRGNDVVLERKLRAEADADADAADSVGSGRSQAELQMHMLRTRGPEALQDEAQRRADALATVHEWNAGFFQPRGITIIIALDDDHDDTTAARDGPGQLPAGTCGWLPNQSSFRMDADGIAYGKRFVMDANGIRLGSLIMDANGIRMASHDNDAPGIPHDSAPWPSSSRNMPGVPGPEPQRGRPAAAADSGKGKDKAHERSSSVSSTSSSSSSSSSVSSLDSLPDYDDVPEQQLPGYVDVLRAWTARPNHLRTNADVAWLRNDLKASRHLSAGAVPSPADRKELKAQVKALLRQWKQIQREQHKAQRGLKSARKKQRRQEKRERRQWKRDVKRSQRDLRRHGGRGGGPCMPPMPPGVSVPPVPPMPSAMHGPPGMGFHDRHHGHHHRDHHRGWGGGWSHHGRGGFGSRGPGFSGAWPPRAPPFTGAWPSRGAAPWGGGGGGGGGGGRHDHGDAPPAAAAAAADPAVAARQSAAQGIEAAIRTQQERAATMADGPGKEAVHSAIASMTASLEALRVVEADSGGGGGEQQRGGRTTAAGCWNTDKDCKSTRCGRGW